MWVITRKDKVGMRVLVDKPGTYDKVLRIDGFGWGAFNLTHPGNRLSFDGDVTIEPGVSGSIDDLAIFDEKRIHESFPPLRKN
jgi:hypothetical protein